MLDVSIAGVIACQVLYQNQRRRETGRGAVVSECAWCAYQEARAAVVVLGLSSCSFSARAHTPRTVVYTCVQAGICICVFVCICVCFSVCVCVCAYASIHTHANTRTHKYRHTHTLTHTLTHTHTHVHTYTHTHIYLYILTCTY